MQETIVGLFGFVSEPAPKTKVFPGSGIKAGDRIAAVMGAGETNINKRFGEFISADDTITLLDSTDTGGSTLYLLITRQVAA